MVYDSQGNKHSLHSLWNRRHCTKFNGVSYPVQRAAEAIYSEEGASQVREIIDQYMNNARMIRKTMTEKGYSCTGGENAPYIWVNGKTDSWVFFDKLLSKAGVVCTPGIGFGRCGEGYIRISALNKRENVEKALVRIGEALSD
jgi:LL-diaminopimelate aminotransferase